MLRITDFLQKFLNLERDKNEKIRIILETTKEITKLELSRGAIEIRGNNIKFNCNPTFRSEIFMHQSQIEAALKSRKIFLKLI